MNSTPSAEDALNPKPTGRKGAVNAISAPPRPPWLRWAVLFYGALAAIAVAWNAWADIPIFFTDRSAQSAGVSWIPNLALGLACAAGVIGLSEVVTQRTHWGRFMAAELGSVLGPLSARQCLWLALLSGVGEELFFRGALQPRLGWLATSLVFGLAHIPPQRALWPWTGFALLAGGLLGGLYLWTGNLVAPIVTHVGINAVNLWLLSRRYGSEAEG